MYEYITGRLAEVAPAYAVVEAGGIGYFINISLQTYSEIENSENTTLYLHYIVREDAQLLYGFATKEERELFQLLFMRDRREEAQSSEDESFDRMVAVVQQNSGLDYEKARLFHLEMWICVHGIATMFATGFLDLPWDLVSKMLTIESCRDIELHCDSLHEACVLSLCFRNCSCDVCCTILEECNLTLSINCCNFSI